jgi:hypothetical protein
MHSLLCLLHAPHRLAAKEDDSELSGVDERNGVISAKYITFRAPGGATLGATRCRWPGELARLSPDQSCSDIRNCSTVVRLSFKSGVYTVRDHLTNLNA